MNPQSSLNFSNPNWSRVFHLCYVFSTADQCAFCSWENRHVGESRYIANIFRIYLNFQSFSWFLYSICHIPHILGFETLNKLPECVWGHVKSRADEIRQNYQPGPCGHVVVPVASAIAIAHQHFAVLFNWSYLPRFSTNSRFV